MNPITLTPATTPADIADVRALCWAYRDFLGSVADVSAAVTSGFHPDAKYKALMAQLPDLHARPTGLIVLARDADGTPVGCGMSHPLSPDTSEIKRVFVTPAARGARVAQQLCEMLVAQAQRDGFSRVVLDTHRALHAAQRLYRRMGFAQRGPYQPLPDAVLPELVFFEKSLKPKSP